MITKRFILHVYYVVMFAYNNALIMISTKIQILKIFKSFCQQIKRVQKRFNSSDNLAFSILRIRESHTHTHTPSPKYTHSFLERSLFFFIILFFYSFFTLFFFFLIKYTTTVSNEMELDNVIYLRMSFHYRKNLR